MSEQEEKQIEDLTGQSEGASSAQHRWDQSARRLLADIVENGVMEELQNFTRMMNRGLGLIEAFTKAIETNVEAIKSGETTGTKAVKDKLHHVMKQFILGRDEMESYMDKVSNIQKATERLAERMDNLEDSARKIHSLENKIEFFIKCMQAQFPDMPRNVGKKGYKPVFRKWLADNAMDWTQDENVRQQVMMVFIGFSFAGTVKSGTCAVCAKPTERSIDKHDRFCLKCLNPKQVSCGEKECIQKFWNNHPENCKLHAAWQGVGRMFESDAKDLPMHKLYQTACEEAGESLDETIRQSVKEMDEIVVVENPKSDSTATSSSSSASSTSLRDIHFKGAQITKTQMKSYLETNQRSNVDVSVNTEDRTNLIIGGATRERLVFKGRNVHYVKWQVAHDSDVCVTYAQKAQCSFGEQCEFLHLKERTKYRDGHSADVKEFERYNRVHSLKNIELVTAQVNAYRNERCWRQYEKGVVIERGIYDPVQWKEKEEAAKAQKVQRKAAKKRKQPGPTN